MAVKKFCENCGKSFATNQNLASHLNRKKSCIAQIKIVFNFSCQRCDKKFQTRQNLNTHLNRKFPCAIKSPAPQEIELQLLFEKLQKEHEQNKLDMEKMSQENQQQKKENQQHKMEIEKMQKQSLNITNHVQHNSNNNNTTNNVTINVYGKEDMSHITENMYKQCFQVVYKSVEKLFALKHFSKDMKQNHNLYITNMNSEHMMMLKNEGWGLVEKAETLDNMYDDIRENLSDAFNELRDKDRVTATMEKQFSSFADDYKVDDDEDEERAKKESCKKMAYLAFNNRQFAIDAQKESKKRK